MSWWTSVDFSYYEPEDFYNPRELELARERMREAIESLVESKGYHRNLATDLRELLACPPNQHNEKAFKINSFAVIDLFSTLAKQFPEVPFAIRGRGEVMEDIWVRVYSGGKVSFDLGPPEDAVI
jgi:hypothetical protein